MSKYTYNSITLSGADAQAFCVTLTTDHIVDYEPTYRAVVDHVLRQLGELSASREVMSITIVVKEDFEGEP